MDAELKAEELALAGTGLSEARDTERADRRPAEDTHVSSGLAGKRSAREDSWVCPTSSQSHNQDGRPKDEPNREEEDDDEDEEGAPLTAAQKKRRLERLRRNLLHERMMELNELVMSGRPDWRKLDKELVMRNAITIITSTRTELTAARTELSLLKSENARLREEKLELREDKSNLRADLDRSKEECRNLRADNVALWQAMRSNGLIPGVGRGSSALDASNNTLAQKYAQLKLPNPEDDLATPEPGVLNGLLYSQAQAQQRPEQLPTAQSPLQSAPAPMPSVALPALTPEIGYASPHSFGKWLSSADPERGAQHQSLLAGLEADHLDLDGLMSNGTALGDWLQKGLT
ncbi:Transcription factor [Porphyridium purpureum]|uniref:Transcription factor n=1 Tax=Porphyridium purpureum TaxID=35688 RepID=A0A5J4YPL7_PORPP|nr:Transcription factor [Porphyridium purpureum]|eukprot:POR3976..scf296_7